MSIYLAHPRLGKGAVFALALAALPVSTACALDAFRETPSVSVTVPGVTSQAQLAQQLQAQGYSGIRLSSVQPDPAFPRPELTVPSDNPQITPVHEGWNGTAMKNGQTLGVVVTYGSAPSVAELPE